MAKKALIEKIEKACGNGGCCKGGGNNSAVYGLGVAGSLFYYIQNSSSVSDFLIGLVKSIIWPAVFTYKLFEWLKF